MSHHVRSIARRDGNRCHLCGWMVPIEEQSIDHVDPKSAGGYNKASNYRLAHKVCNHARASLPMEIVRRVLDELAERYAFDASVTARYGSDRRPPREAVVQALYAASKVWQRAHTKTDQRRAREALKAAARPGRDLARARAVRHQRVRETS